MHGARVDRLEDVWLGELTRLLPELRAGRPDLPALPPVTDGMDSSRDLIGIVVVPKSPGTFAPSGGRRSPR
jgi:hypothetical protein